MNNLVRICFGDSLKVVLCRLVMVTVIPVR